VSFQTTPADPIIKRVETVGKALPHVTAKIVDTDGNIVPRGTPGEIRIKGYLVQKGYGRPPLVLFACINERWELTFNG
jgi:acyl-CoA synthetase (AMP-forming)/AMP-acid ligase II